MRSLIALACIVVAAGMSSPALSEPCTKVWERWQRFGAEMISPEGRVVDASDDRLITTSEGQSYALFFSLVDNDPAMFWRVLRWTEKNLAGGDLTARLPAWLWGKRDTGEWGVLDANSASDSDLWIAYALLEAGRLWKQHSYTALGTLLLQRIAREEVVDLPGFGAMLLPGKVGFIREDSWRLNPSYLPPQVLARVAQAQPVEPWLSLRGNALRFLIESAPGGLAPDWISWSGSGFESRADDERFGSYNAIRVYLWAGMLHPDFAGGSGLKRHFLEVARLLDAQGMPPERIDVDKGVAFGVAPPGFAAALIPLLGERVEAKDGVAGYYNAVLTLFGEGWGQGRFRFHEDGALAPAWKACQ